MIFPFRLTIMSRTEAVGVTPLAAMSKSFTVETVAEFRKQAKGDDLFYLIIGSDSLLDLVNWVKPEEIIKLAQVVVYPRIGFNWQEAPESFKEKIKFIDNIEKKVSKVLITK